jgi:hypothetical protein
LSYPQKASSGREIEMVQQRRLIYLPLVGVALIGLLAGVYLLAGRRFMKKDAQGGVARHTVETPAEDVLKYWTADKMRSARPAPLPKVDASEKKRKRRLRRLPRFLRSKQA